MKKLILFGLLMALASCTPQSFSVLVDKKKPVESGIDITGKSVCLVYLKNGCARDSVFSSNFCDGFAQGLEKSFFGSEKAVEVFSLEKDAVTDYGNKEEMVKLIVGTNADIVFLLDIPRIVTDDDGTNSCIYTVYSYDSMSKKADDVKEFRKSGNLTETGENSEMFASDAQFMGFSFCKQFDVEWEKRQYSFIYFESVNSAWTESIEAVYYQKWQDAINIWIPFAESDTGQMASCASYNIALACHLLGENELALEWLDHSDEIYPVSLSPGLRKRIEAEL